MLDRLPPRLENTASFRKSVANALSTYLCTTNSSLKMSPLEALVGCRPRHPGDTAPLQFTANDGPRRQRLRMIRRFLFHRSLRVRWNQCTRRNRNHAVPSKRKGVLLVNAYPPDQEALKKHHKKTRFLRFGFPMHQTPTTVETKGGITHYISSTKSQPASVKK